MPLVSQLWHWCWFASTPLCGVVLARLFVTRFYKEVPVFTTFAGWLAAGSAALIYMNYAPSITPDQYYFAFALVSAVTGGLAFAVIHEVFRHIFEGYPALTQLSTRLFRRTTIVLICIAIGLAWLAPASGAGQLMATFYTLGRTFDTVLCGLLLFLFIFSSSLGLSWRSNIFGIALGIGVMTLGTLAAYAIRSQVEPTVRNGITDVLDLVTESSTLAGVVTWTIYLFAHERGPSRPSPDLPAHVLETWTQELQRLLHHQ